MMILDLRVQSPSPRPGSRVGAGIKVSVENQNRPKPKAKMPIAMILGLFVRVHNMFTVVSSCFINKLIAAVKRLSCGAGD